MLFSVLYIEDIIAALRRRGNISGTTAEIVEKNLDDMVRFAFFRTGNHAAAEDLVHDAVVKLLQAHTTPRNPKTYLFRILYNLCVDSGKKQFETIPIEEIEEPYYSPEDEAEMVNERKRIVQSLEFLTEDKREIVMMRAVDNLKFSEIAEIVAAPLTTVQSRYNAAIKELKQHYIKSGDL